MLAELIADREHGVGCEIVFAVKPEFRLRCGDARPVAAGKRKNVISIHAGIVAPTSKAIPSIWTVSDRTETRQGFAQVKTALMQRGC